MIHKIFVIPEICHYVLSRITILNKLLQPLNPHNPENWMWYACLNQTTIIFDLYFQSLRNLDYFVAYLIRIYTLSDTKFHSEVNGVYCGAIGASILEL